MDDLTQNPPPCRRALRCLKIGLVLWLVTAMYVQLDVGLADQGDFLRAASWCTPAPVGLQGWSNWGTPERPRRFFRYYLPYWQSQPYGVGRMLTKVFRAKTSTALLWFPGVLLDRLLYCNDVLYLPIVSWFPRLLLVGALFALFAWIDTGPERHKAAVHLVLGVPLVLLFSATDYLVYFNSFFQETGSFVYLVAWIASLLYLRRRPRSVARGALCLAALVLLVCAKLSNVYWVAAGLPFLVFLWRPWPWPRRQITRWGLCYAATGSVVMAAFFSCGRCGELAPHHEFNSLFSGILSFSYNPSARLAELGLGDAADCVGKPWCTPVGMKFLARNGDRLSYLLTLRVAWAEPAAMLRMLKYTADNTQDLSTEELGRHALFDPLAAPLSVSHPLLRLLAGAYRNPCTQRWWDPEKTSPLNFWSYVKFHVFPTGYPLLLALAAYAAVFTACLRKGGLLADLALVGLMCAVACAADACVAICGEGITGLIKHLFLANMLFDFASIAMLGAIALVVLRAGKTAASSSHARRCNVPAPHFSTSPSAVSHVPEKDSDRAWSHPLSTA
jgi:hypothetical protein